MNKKKFLRTLKGTSETKNSILKKEVSKERWIIAHDSEEEFWKKYTTDSLKARSTTRYKNKANKLLKIWSDYMPISKDIKILQIGCGPEDIINHFKIGITYSIDPLADFYKEKFDYDYKKSNLIKAQGEQIPFKNNFFDVIILTNVLDHTQSPTRVLSEIRRVLKDKGIFYFENYIYQKNFLRIACLYGRLKEIIKKEIFNIHHPYMFTLKDVQDLIIREFKIIHTEIGNEIEAYESPSELRKNILIQNNKFHIKLLAYFWILGTINCSFICRKR